MTDLILDPCKVDPNDPLYLDSDHCPFCNPIGVQLIRIEQKLDEVLKTMARTEQMVEKVVDEVKPTIDDLMSSNLFKMLGMKKKS